LTCDDSGTVEPTHGMTRSIEGTSIATGDDAITIAQKISDTLALDSEFISASNTVDATEWDEPWAPRRHPAYPAEGGVDFRNVLTYRDTPLERCIQILFDTGIEDHFYQDDGYGDMA